MTPSGFVFFLMCVLLWKKAKMNQLETAVHQEGGFISADVGGNVSLQCSYGSEAARNLNNSHVGTYYCAVASCGRVLFGNGTKLDLKSEAFSLFLVYFLSAALIFTAILTVLLAFTLHKMHKRNSCQPSVFKARLSFRPATNAEGHQDPDSLHYAAVDSNQLNRSRRNRKSTETECVYSTMMQ
ncbi:uncharacterized protein LOC105925518 isoform X2 [Fundulus heteroclitus]|uniref:uncharacterized protein LOC105925518 isoform X2 n=1 Tax=Fundulus heteroclitus TaxID=8078 RepID=UPI00165C7A2C|nr:uncharacterized protein LOC105925518 isoform X2 [Fundulus heteroclitus]